MVLLMSGELILASSSEVRKELLEKSNIPFVSVKPNIDEDTVKSSLLLVIIWALHVEQPWEIEGNEYITVKHRKAILYKVFNCNKALSWNKQQHL